MSGFSALVTFDGTPVPPGDLERMAQAAAYRGLGRTTIWTDAGVGLVQQTRRVATRERPGALPRRAGLVAVADVRLDERAALVVRLVRGGVLADGAVATDVDLLLAAYRLWGDACAAHLVGDFAFVIFDQRRRRVFAARDPMGMRPLYVRLEPGRRVLAASEIKQLLAAPRVPCAIDELGVAATLAGPYLPPDRTLYEGIGQLAPGHALVVDAEGSRTWRAWQPDPRHVVDAGDDDCAARYRDTLTRAVADRITSAGPVGIFLSGGMDSGSIASTAGWLRERDVIEPVTLHTYSWAFSELPNCDERGVSQRIVDRYSLDATAIPADAWWPLAGHPEHGPDRDDPFCSVYQGLLEQALARCRADGMGVVLSGDRGDELTGDWIYDELGLVREGRLRDAWHDLRRVMADDGASLFATLRRTVARPVLDVRCARAAVAMRRIRGREWHGPPWVTDELSRRVDLPDVIADHVRPARFDGTARSLRAQRIFMAQGARAAVLRERTQARHGLAFADPFADRRLVELVLALPQQRVQRRGAPKQLARTAMRGIIPPAALEGASKTIPTGLFDRGFRDRAVDVVTDLLTDPLAARHGWLDGDAARAAYEQYRARGHTAYDFWWPLCVEMWLRRWWS